MTPWYDTQNKAGDSHRWRAVRDLPDCADGLVVPGDPRVPSNIGPHSVPQLCSQNRVRVFAGCHRRPARQDSRRPRKKQYSRSATASSTAPLKMPPASLKSGMRRMACTILLRYPPRWHRHSSIVPRGIMRQAERNSPSCFLHECVATKIRTPRFNWVQATPISGSDYLNPHDKIPNVQEFELSLQRQLGSSTVVECQLCGIGGPAPLNL